MRPLPSSSLYSSHLPQTAKINVRTKISILLEKKKVQVAVETAPMNLAFLANAKSFCSGKSRKRRKTVAIYLREV